MSSSMDLESKYCARNYHPLPVVLTRACELTGQDMSLPMNTGAEAVETAIKAARKWAYTVKGVAENMDRLRLAS